MSIHNKLEKLRYCNCFFYYSSDFWLHIVTFTKQLPNQKFCLPPLCESWHTRVSNNPSSSKVRTDWCRMQFLGIHFKTEDFIFKIYLFIYFKVKPNNISKKLNFITWPQSSSKLLQLTYTARGNVHSLDSHCYT